jgi:hypothetical protein
MAEKRYDLEALRRAKEEVGDVDEDDPGVKRARELDADRLRSDDDQRGEESTNGAGVIKNGRGRHVQPWATKKLVRLRRRQRQQLRALPTKLVDELHVPRPAVQLEGDETLVEVELRRQARAWSERPEVADVLDDLTSKLAGDVLLETLQKTDLPVDAQFAIDPIRHRDTTVAETELEVQDPNAYAAVRAFAMLATMADRLADDAYLDPRVRHKR